MTSEELVIKLFEVRDEKDEIVAEAPIIVYNPARFRELLMLYLPQIVESMPRAGMAAMLTAADNANGDGMHVIEDGVRSYVALLVGPNVGLEDEEPEDEPWMLN